jgi:hypothetical protein
VRLLCGSDADIAPPIPASLPVDRLEYAGFEQIFDPLGVKEKQKCWQLAEPRANVDLPHVVDND